MNNAADMLSVLDDHGFIDTDEATKLAYLNDAITDFCAREAWPFLEAQPATLQFDGTDSAPSVGMPTNFRAALSISDASTGRLIMPERIETLEGAQANLTLMTGDPQFFYFIGTEINFAPIPPASFTARLRYVQYHPEITDSSDASSILVPQRLWMVLVFGALIRLYDQDDDPESSARFETHFETRIMSIRNEIWQRQFNQPDHIVMPDLDY